MQRYENRLTLTNLIKLYETTDTTISFIVRSFSGQRDTRVAEFLRPLVMITQSRPQKHLPNRRPKLGNT